jgi:hypothetical protein
MEQRTLLEGKWKKGQNSAGFEETANYGKWIEPLGGQTALYPLWEGRILGLKWELESS